MQSKLPKHFSAPDYPMVLYLQEIHTEKKFKKMKSKINLKTRNIMGVVFTFRVKSCTTSEYF